jgi:hypothetical protein
LQVTAFLAALGVKEISHYDQPGHFGYTETKIASALLSCSKTGYSNPFMGESGESSTSSLTMRYIVTDSLITIAKEFSKASSEGYLVFDEEAYAKKVYLNNADVWGALSSLLPFARIRSGRAHMQQASGMLRGIMTKYMYSSQYAAKAIPIDKLISDLHDVAITILQENGVAHVKAFAKSVRTPHGAGIREKNFLYFLKAGKIEAPRFNHLPAKGIASSVTPKAKAAGMTKKTRRTRCPNGTRRNRRTGNCEPASS